MEDNNINVPYIVHEGIVARLERIIKRLWILCIIMFLALVISNVVWVWYESQWQYVETTNTNEISQEVTSEGNATIGDININDKSKSDD